MAEEVVLSSLSMDQYLSLRDKNYSEVMNKFDPFRPKPQYDQEVIWWNEKVKSGMHQVKGIDLHGETIGFVHAFAFRSDEKRCEIGFGIFEVKYHSRKIGKKAVGMWIDELSLQSGIQFLSAETNSRNVAAIRLLKSLDFQETSEYEDDGVHWIVLDRATS